MAVMSAEANQTITQGAFIVERSGTDVDEALSTLRHYESNIWVISQVIQNDISSTKVRLFLKKDLSVRWVSLLFINVPCTCEDVLTREPDT